MQYRFRFDCTFDEKGEKSAVVTHFVLVYNKKRVIDLIQFNAKGVKAFEYPSAFFRFFKLIINDSPDVIGPHNSFDCFKIYLNKMFH